METENITYSKYCDNCNKKSRIENSVQWYDKTNQNVIYYYCKGCFGKYWNGLIKMNRKPEDHIFVIKHAYGNCKI